MLVTTSYCIIGDITLEYVKKETDGETSTQLNILLPESIKIPALSEAVPVVLPANVPVADTVLVTAADTSVATVSDATTAAPSSTPDQPLEVVAQPLGAAEMTMGVAAPTATRKERAVPAFIRGLYTTLFTLLGMLGAGVTYLKDNLDKLFQLDWKVYAVVAIGAVLSGIMYALKKYYKPDGLL